jgi:hypothetical protein
VSQNAGWNYLRQKQPAQARAATQDDEGETKQNTMECLFSSGVNSLVKLAKLLNPVKEDKTTTADRRFEEE